MLLSRLVTNSSKRLSASLARSCPSPFSSLSPSLLPSTCTSTCTSTSTFTCTSTSSIASPLLRPRASSGSRQLHHHHRIHCHSTTLSGRSDVTRFPASSSPFLSTSACTSTRSISSASASASASTSASPSTTATATAFTSRRHHRFVAGFLTFTATATSLLVATAYAPTLHAAKADPPSRSASSSSSSSPSASSSSSSSSSSRYDIASLNDDGITFTKFRAPSTGAPLIVLVSNGSFSPITNMHLLVFEQAKNYLMYETNQFDVIGGILSPVHDLYGKSSLIAAEHRIAMCERAVRDSDWINVFTWETKQPQWTTTAEVLSKYQSAINNSHIYSEPVRVVMLCGADLLESTLVPDLWSKEDLQLIFGTFGVAVIERQGLDLPHLIDSNPSLKQYASHIHIIPQRILNTISSTSVRKLYAQNLSTKYLVPDAVREYIQENELYGWKKEIEKERKQVPVERKDF